MTGDRLPSPLNSIWSCKRDVHNTFCVISILAIVLACGEDDHRGEPASREEPDTLVATPISIHRDLRLRDGFDYSSYYGVIGTPDSLSRLWSQLVNVQREFYGRANAGVPEQPEVDFGREQVIWFADRGVGASFVDSLEVSSVGADTALVTVHVFHSDFGSSGLNLWRIPRTRRVVNFEVRHRYESIAP